MPCPREGGDLLITAAKPASRRVAGYVTTMSRKTRKSVGSRPVPLFAQRFYADGFDLPWFNIELAGKGA